MDKERLLAEMLRAELDATAVEVIDESAQHAGHREAPEAGASHYAVRIVASCFEDMPLLGRHRLVYDAIGDLAAMGIHALRIEAATPSEASA